MSAARLLILAEERLLRMGLASLLGRLYETDTARVPGEAATAVGDRPPDAAVWYGDRIDADTVNALAELGRAYPGLRLCVLARAADAGALESIKGLDHDGLALLLRRSELDVGDLMDSLDAVLAGHTLVEPAVLARMVEHGHGSQDALAALTAPEEEVLELMAFGLRNREIARRIWKSEKAVEKHVSAVFQKLELGPDRTDDLDRRVAAARIYFASRPHRMSAGRRRSTLSGHEPTITRGPSVRHGVGSSRASNPRPEWIPAFSD